MEDVLITSARCLFNRADIQCSASIRVASHSLDRCLINMEKSYISLFHISTKRNCNHYAKLYDHNLQGTSDKKKPHNPDKNSCSKQENSYLLAFPQKKKKKKQLPPSDRKDGSYIKTFSWISLDSPKLFICFTSNLKLTEIYKHFETSKHRRGEKSKTWK